MLLIVAFTTVICGCTGSSGSATPVPTAGNSVVVTAVPSNPLGLIATVPPGSYKITAESNGVKITGNGVVNTTSFDLPANWYTVKTTYAGSPDLSHMSYFEYWLVNDEGIPTWNDLANSAGFWIHTDCVHYPESMDAGKTDAFTLVTKSPTYGDWSVELLNPPASVTMVSGTQTFTGTGCGVVGPLQDSSGKFKVTINYNGPASIFRAEFYESDVNYKDYPSFFITLDDYNFNNLDSGTPTTPLEKTQDVDTGYSDAMLLFDITATDNAPWTVTVTPE